MSPELQELRDSLIDHIQSFGGSLHTQMQQMEERILSCFAPVEARLERHGGLIRGGSVQIALLVEWSEKVDAILAQQQAEIADLKRRLENR